MSHPPATSLARITYPAPPWVLWGSMLVATFLLRADAVRERIPDPLQLITLPGGFAMGFIAVSRYTAGSTREYSEVLAGTVVRYHNHYGPFITESGVDDRQAQMGGQEIWKLPRQLWRFDWEFDERETRVRVWDGVRLVLQISDVPTQARLFPSSLHASMLNAVAGQAALIPGTYMIRATSAAWNLQLPPDSPLAYLRPTSPIATLIIKGVADVDALKVLPDAPPA